MMTGMLIGVCVADSWLTEAGKPSIDFDDTYDGLGDQLEEANDDFNDDTFGGGTNDTASATKPVGKDFDFFGQTAKVSDAISEEQMRFSRQQAPSKSVASISSIPPKPTSKPARTGYEKYKEPNYISDLQVDPSLWGSPVRPVGGETHGAGRLASQSTTSSQAPAPSAAPARKMMSLEEVEAAMRSQAKQPAPAPAALPQARQQTPHQQLKPQQYNQVPIMQSVPPFQSQQGFTPQSSEIPRHYQQPSQQFEQRQRSQSQMQPVNAQTNTAQPTVQPSQRFQPQPHPPTDLGETVQPRQILQNPRRHQAPQDQSQQLQSAAPILPVAQSWAPTGFIHPSAVITHPQQLMQLSEEERAAFLVEDAKRAKRNHKIFLLSKDNGLMTPQDKNFITRIQLQQLMTATGNTNEQDPDAALAEDFYYQVHSQIRGGPRQNPHQPLSHFAQTYLFQTGGRQGGLGRSQYRGGDNHMQRMEQQVQRAVEAAKLKPKNKQLVIEGSLGKISFSNAKTPKPLLNIKRNESGDLTNRPQSAGRQPSKNKVPQTEMSASDRKSILRNIEAVYSTLMKIEDHERREPPPPTDDTDASTVQQHMEWRHTMQLLTQDLWNELKVMEPVNPGSTIPHPFIALLSYPKGKKAIPRVFRHIHNERVTMVTMIVFHLDILDVIRLGQLQPGETQLPTAARDAIDLFTQSVMPSLIGFFSEAPLDIIIGMLGVILEKVNTRAIARTKVGLGILTLLLSRAELVKQAGGVSEQEWNLWNSFYNRLFDILEPTLGGIFPGSINSGEDMYVWQFLAAVGINASPDQQQRLVIAVKYVLM